MNGGLGKSRRERSVSFEPFGACAQNNGILLFFSS
jgi:hypothetical protein